MKSSLKKRLPKILVILAYAVFCLISYRTGIGCVWKHLFGIPCPGCGFTRAVVSACRLDFAAAFSYHPMFWSLPLLILYFLFGDKTSSRVPDRLMLVLLAGFLIVWVFRTFVI